MSVETVADVYESEIPLSKDKRLVTRAAHVKEIQNALPKYRFEQFLKLNSEGHRIIFSGAFLDVIEKPRESDLTLINDYIDWFCDGKELSALNRENGARLISFEDLVAIMPEMIARYYTDRKTIGSVSLQSTVKVLQKKKSQNRKKITEGSSIAAGEQSDNMIEFPVQPLADEVPSNPDSEIASVTSIHDELDVDPFFNDTLVINNSPPIEQDNYEEEDLGDDNVDDASDKELVEDDGTVSSDIETSGDSKTSYNFSERYKLDKDYNEEKITTTVVSEPEVISQKIIRSYKPRPVTEIIQAPLPDLWKVAIEGRPVPAKDVERAADVMLERALGNDQINESHISILKNLLFDREHERVLTEANIVTLNQINSMLLELTSQGYSRLDEYPQCRSHLHDLTDVVEGKVKTVAEMTDDINQIRTGRQKVNQAFVVRRILGALKVVFDSGAKAEAK